MPSRSEQPPSAADLVWDRPEPASRPAPSPLSRERIVRAALAIADRDGLAAVSLRNVGAALDAGPMRLYSYLSTKEELLDLMVDAVYGEIAAGDPLPADWRDALRAVAHRLRSATRAHPWVTAVLGGRPHFGPNALAFLEASFAALTGTPRFDDIDVAMQALRVVNAYVIGAVQREASELPAERDAGLRKAAGQTATGPYLHRMLASGRFPTLARVVRDGTPFSADRVFDQGLDWVLDGVAARLPR